VLHCHGTLVRHDDGSWECSAPWCGGDPVGHDFVLGCADVWAVCCDPRRAAGAGEGSVREGDLGLREVFRTAGAA
jgi:hypothetical protein